MCESHLSEVVRIPHFVRDNVVKGLLCVFHIDMINGVLQVYIST